MFRLALCFSFLSVVLAQIPASKGKGGEDVWNGDCPDAVKGQGPFNYVKWRDDLGGEDWIPLSAKSCYDQLDGVDVADMMKQGDIYPHPSFNGEGWKDVRDRKIWICHGTASEVNPYNLINVDANSLCGHIFNDQHNAGNSLEKRADIWPGQLFSAEGKQYQALCNCEVVSTDGEGKYPEGETKQVDDGKGGKNDEEGPKDGDKSSIDAKGQGPWSVLFDENYGYGFKRNPTLGAMVIAPDSGVWKAEGSIDRWVGLMKTGELKTFVYAEATTGSLYKAEITGAGLGEFVYTTMPELPPAIGIWKAATTQDDCLSQTDAFCDFPVDNTLFTVTKKGIKKSNQQGKQFWPWNCGCSSDEDPATATE